jgi:Family of unknown function (DUF6088)
MTAIAQRIMRRARAQTAHGTRMVFTSSDFLDYGDRAAVDQALSRLTKGGNVRRVARGMYDIPRINPILKRPAAPDLDAVIDAVARRDNVTIVPNGMATANRLGLTNAVSARNDYLTDGSSRTVRVGKSVIRLKHAGPKLMALKDRPAGDVVRAVHWLGHDLAADDVADTLRRRLSDSAKKDLVRARGRLDPLVMKVVDRVLAEA